MSSLCLKLRLIDKYCPLIAACCFVLRFFEIEKVGIFEEKRREM